MRKSLIASVSSFALIAGVFVGGASNAATLRVPKTTFAACAQVNGTYCVESVVITTAQGKTVPLMWVPSGNPVPAAPAGGGISYAPIAQLNAKGQVIRNDWWTNQIQRDVLTSGTAAFLDVSSLINTPNFPDQGAVYDSTTKKFDTTLDPEFFSSEIDCWDAKAKSSSKKAWKDCFKGSLLVVNNGKVAFEFDYATADLAAAAFKAYSTSKFVDLKDLANQQQMPDLGAKYDATTKTFDKMIPLVTPIWVTNNALVNGWDVAGTVATQPQATNEVAAGAVSADAATTPSTTATTATDAGATTATTADTTTGDGKTAGSVAAQTGTADVAGSAAAPLAPDSQTQIAPQVEKGRALQGRWTTPAWATLMLNNLGYDGLFVNAKSANEFSNNLFIDVNPVLTEKDNKTYLAAQPGTSGAYAQNLDPDIVIKVTVRTGDIQTGVTVAVGVDTNVTTQDRGDYTLLTVEGTAVTVPLATDPNKDCTGETGKAKANVRQFQTLIIPQNDQGGFGIDGVSGNLYVGSNGVCSLSTPVWDQANKSFTWEASAPHFAPDGQTVNKGFYKAVIPFKDAALLWGLTNPADAATALKVSITTEAGGSTAAINVVSAKNNKIIIDVSGFSYSRPKLSISLKKGYKPSTKKVSTLPAPKYTITCALGATTKKVTGTAPTCPKGFKKVGAKS